MHWIATHCIWCRAMKGQKHISQVWPQLFGSAAEIWFLWLEGNFYPEISVTPPPSIISIISIQQLSLPQDYQPDRVKSDILYLFTFHLEIPILNLFQKLTFKLGFRNCVWCWFWLLMALEPLYSSYSYRYYLLDSQNPYCRQKDADNHFLGWGWSLDWHKMHQVSPPDF